MAGGIGSQHAGAARALRRGEHPELRGRQRRHDGALRGRPRRGRRLRRARRAPEAMEAGEIAVLWCTRPTRSTPCPSRPASPRRWPRCRTRCPRRSCSTRPRRSATCSCPSRTRLERWDDLRPRAGVQVADAAGHGAGVRHPAHRRGPAPGGARRRAARSPACRRRRGRSTSRRGGRVWPRPGARATSAAFWRHDARRGRRVRRRAGGGGQARARRAGGGRHLARLRRRGRVPLRPLGLVAAVRRPRHQQAVAAREPRPGHQDHLAVLGRDPPRDGGASSTSARARSSARLADGHASRRRSTSTPASAATWWRCRSGYGHTELRAVRHGPRRQRARPPRRPPATRASCRTSPPGSRLEKTAPLPEGGQDRGQHPAARPRHRRGDAAGARRGRG